MYTDCRDFSDVAIATPIIIIGMDRTLKSFLSYMFFCVLYHVAAWLYSFTVTSLIHV